MQRAIDQALEDIKVV